MKRWAIILLIFILPIGSCAMGPIYTGPRIAVWDAVPNAMGYYLYWRAPGAEGWPDTQRVLTTATTLDMPAAGVPQGTWEVCVSAFDSVSESGPSNIVAWAYAIISAPGNLKKQ